MRLFTPLRPSLFLAGALALASTCSVFGQGRVAQTLDAFYSPAAAAFSTDGRTLFITNAARADYGMLAGRGAVSRLDVAADGKLTVANARLAEGLNAPLGIAVLPVAVGEFPAGTLVVAVGGRWTVVDRSTPMDDARERGTGLVFLDPATGARLGAIFLGDGSKVEGPLGHAVADPGPVTVDGRGTVFVADVAGLGLSKNPEDRKRAGIVRLSAAAVVALARDEVPPAASVSFLNVPEVVGGMTWYERDRILYWVTGPGYGDMAGAVLRLDGGEFGPGGQIETVAKDASAMVGACITSSGSLIAAESVGSMAVIKRGRGRLKTLKFRERTVFISPGQPAATTLADGTVLVVVPEMASGGRPAWRHRVQTFTLGSDF